MIGTVVSVARFATGRDLVGPGVTDARWSRPGTQTAPGVSRASRWAFYSHRRRAGIRLAGVAAAVLLVYGSLTDWWSTVTSLRAAVWLLIAVGIWAVVEKSRRYAHRREVVAPLAEALAEKLGDSRYVLDPRSWIYVPVDVHDRPTRVYLPRDKTFTDAQEKQLVKLVSGRIGLVAPRSTFDMRGERPFMEVRPAPAPREMVSFRDAAVRAVIDASPDGQPLFGLAARDEPCRFDLDAEAPHIGMSMATGAGKSVGARAIIAQVLRSGGIVLIADRKIVSQAWCDGLPGVRYARSQAEIHDALLDCSAEIDRRFAAIQASADLRGNVDPSVVGPRFLLVCEELNTLEMDLRAYWREIRESGEPTMSPALAVLGRFVAMGRQGRMHMLAISQKLTCQCIGGTAARENLSIRVLGRATASTWRMLAPECAVSGKFPRSSKHRGRVHVVFGDEATPVQILYIDEQDARDYAEGGVVTAFPTRGCPTTTRSGSPAQMPVLGHLRAVPDDPTGDEVTLADAVEEQVVTGNLDALRRASTRSGFPSPVGRRGAAKTYSRAELADWELGRSVAAGGVS